MAVGTERMGLTKRRSKEIIDGSESPDMRKEEVNAREESTFI